MPKNYPGIRAGQYRDLVEVQERKERFDAANAVLPPKWENIGREWALIEQVQGFRALEIEGVYAQQLLAVSSYNVKIRFRNDVTTKHRIKVIGPPDLFLNILSVGDPDGRRRKLLMICTAGLIVEEA